MVEDCSVAAVVAAFEELVVVAVVVAVPVVLPVAVQLAASLLQGTDHHTLHNPHHYHTHLDITGKCHTFYGRDTTRLGISTKHPSD